MSARRPDRILLFDSGTGGLTVARQVAEQLPEADLIYAADNDWFPYGNWPEPVLVQRIVAVIGALIDHVAPHAVVIACNTASTLAMQQLRDRFAGVPFIGTVPAIKPAATQSTSGIIGVLATPGTVRREYTRALIDTYASHCQVFLHGAEGLAAIAERKLYGQAADRKAVLREIRPVFKRRDGRRTDIVVLGCTHYPLMLEELIDAAPWPVTFIDPAPAIARRVVQVMDDQRLHALGGAESPVAAGTVLLTAAATSPVLEAYARFGFPKAEVFPVGEGAMTAQSAMLQALPI